MTDSIIRELEEDIRRDRAVQIWKKHGRFIIGLCVAVVLGTAGGVGWKHYRASQQQEATRGLLMAVEKNTAEGWRAEAAKGGTHGAIAGLRLGDVERNAGRGKEALDAYLAVVNNGAAEPSLRNLARVLALHTSVQFSLTMPDLPAISGEEPFQGAWSEAEAWRLAAAGKTGEAVTRLRQLAEEDSLPPSARERAEMMAAHLASADTKSVSEEE